jgi:hypothetical protein
VKDIRINATGCLNIILQLMTVLSLLNGCGSWGLTHAKLIKLHITEDCVLKL